MPTSDAATRISDVLTRRQRLSFFLNRGFSFSRSGLHFFPHIHTHPREARRQQGLTFFPPWTSIWGISRPFSRRQFLPLKQTSIPATQSRVFFFPQGLTFFSPWTSIGVYPGRSADVNSCHSADVNSCHSSRRQFLPLKEGFPQFPYLAVSFFRPRQLSRIDKHHNHRSTLSTRWARTQGRVVLFCFRNAQQNRRNNLLIPSQKHSVDTSGDGTDPMESRSPFGFRVPPNKSQKFC